MSLDLFDDGPALAAGIEAVQPARAAKAEAMEELVDHQSWAANGLS